MNQSFKVFFRNHGVKITLLVVILLILVDSFFTYRYKLALSENIEVQKRLEAIAAHKGTIISNLNNVDMSIRGYLLVQNDAYLGTYEKVKAQTEPAIAYLERHLPAIGIPATTLVEMDKMLESYFELMDEAVMFAQDSSMDKALKIIKEDHGTAVWKTYMQLSGVIDPIIEKEKAAAEMNYSNLLTMSIVFQTILFLVGIPTLVFTIVNLVRAQRRRLNLFCQLDSQNRMLIFDSGAKADIDNEDSVIGGMIDNLNKAANFIKSISQGDYDVKWEGYSEAGSEVNQENISGALLLMRDEMKKKREEGVRQAWVSDGLNKIAEIIRDNQTNFQILCEKTVGFIIKYLKAQQGGLFVLRDEDESDPHLALVCCYAFDKKKFVERRVEIGEGVLGQIFLEGEPVYLKDVPRDYMKITSGLGESTPRCVTIFPMKHNEVVVALIEIASFTPYDEFAIDFLANCCKSIAASIMAIQSTEKTKMLLEKSQQQAEEMRAQEEEMRQNMEELEATQEEMKRREADLREHLAKTRHEAA